MIDSVFDPLISRFQDEKSIIPKRTIEKAMDEVEAVALKAMGDLFESEVDRIIKAADRAIENQDPVAIASLNWSVSAQLQKIFFDIWMQGWELGEAHGINAQQKAIPRKLKTEAGLRFSKYQSLDVLAAIRSIFALEPVGLRNTAAEQAILRRLITLSGDFSDDTLKRLKADLLASIQPQPTTGEPITREELQERIQNTLKVTQNRAEMIARTETTNAYNQGRLETYQRSSLVTHVRFLAIVDDRTTDICMSRNGIIIPVSDAGEVNANTPPLHVRCRSVLSPIMPSINKSHAAMVDDPQRSPNNRSLVPLPNGWNGAQPTDSQVRSTENTTLSKDDVVKIGRDYFGSFLDKQPEDTKQAYKEFFEASDQINKARMAYRFEKMQSNRTTKKELQLEREFDQIAENLKNTIYKNKNAVDGVFSSFRRQLLEKGSAALDTVTEKVLTPKKNQISKKEENFVLPIIQEYEKLNGKQIPTIIFIKTKPRAFAQAVENQPFAGFINIGDNVDKSIIFHEITHILEDTDSMRLGRSVSFLESKAKGSPVPLSRINRKADPEEMIVPDNFADPYVGKIYKNTRGEWTGTEVGSVGMEHIADAESMAVLYGKDKEHFELMIGEILLSHGNPN